MSFMRFKNHSQDWLRFGHSPILEPITVVRKVGDGMPLLARQDMAWVPKENVFKNCSLEGE